MSDWLTILKKPDDLQDADFANYFADIARVLLNGARLRVNNSPHRLTEIEFYYHGPDHFDKFAHRDPLQLHTGRWYFHRTGGVHRSGSFKGLDLAFGTPGCHAGILFRGLEKPDGTLVDGPSLLVDHLLDATGAPDVPTLDRTIGERLAWDATNPLRLELADDLPAKTIVQSARVGLTLKRSKPTAAEPPRYILRTYRFLNEARRIAKGKLLLVLALYAQGKGADEIQQLTGCPKATAQRYINDFEAGKKQADLLPFFGKEMGPKDLCVLHGAWYGLREQGKLP